MLTFPETAAFLERLGCFFESNNDKFVTVTLSLTPLEWCRLCMAEDGLQTLKGVEEHRSAYVGNCCGNSSAAQDVLNLCFRFGGNIDAHKLVDLGEAMEDHGDTRFMEVSDDALRGLVNTATRGGFDSPWDTIALVYHLVKPYHLPDYKSGDAPRRSQVSNALTTASRIAMNFWWAASVSSSVPEAKSTRTARNILEIAKFLPALRVLVEHAQKMCPEAVNGYAIVDAREGAGEIASNRMGSCIYATAAEAEYQIDMGRTPEHFKVRPVRVSIDKGIEFLDEGPASVERPVMPSPKYPSWVQEAMEDPRAMFDQYAEKNSIPPEMRNVARKAFLESAEYFSLL